MNTQQAKFILQGYRPNGADAGDATFGDALEQARSDQPLQDWFKREMAFDSAVSAKLNEVAAPAGLREAILAGGRVTSGESPRRVWWRQPAWMAMAASIALVGAVTVAFWPRPAAAGTAFSEFVVNDARHSETHGGEGDQAGALQAKLALPDTRLGASLAADFDQLRTTGCRKVTFQGRDVLEVCFKRNGAWFHCYIVRRADFPSLVATAVPKVTDLNHMALASWAEAGEVFMVVSKSGHEALERLL